MLNLVDNKFRIYLSNGGSANTWSRVIKVKTIQVQLVVNKDNGVGISSLLVDKLH